MWMLLILSQSFLGLLVAGSLELPPLTADEILSRMGEASSKHHSIEYSCTRQYTLRNSRFGKQSSVSVHMTYRPGRGKDFIVVTRTGSETLNRVIDRLVESEATESRPNTARQHEISAANYEAFLLGTETAAGRRCYVLALRPRDKSKYLIKGKVWVDGATFEIARLEGQTAGSVSAWVGRPVVAEDFMHVEGIWVPAHVRSASSTLLLGPSELEIDYSDYEVGPGSSAMASLPENPAPIDR
jgi:outer membrane lipoprotein-sorting protein